MIQPQLDFKTFSVNPSRGVVRLCRMFLVLSVAGLWSLHALVLTLAKLFLVLDREIHIITSNVVRIDICPGF